MKRTLTALTALLLVCAAAPAQNPVAPKAAQGIEGNARFTILTDRLVRMEWAPDAKFEDNASLAIVNRDLPVPAFTVSRSGGKLVVKTKALTLEYKGGEFDASNLQVTFRLNGKPVKCIPGPMIPAT